MHCIWKYPLITFFPLLFTKVSPHRFLESFDEQSIVFGSELQKLEVRLMSLQVITTLNKLNQWEDVPVLPKKLFSSLVQLKRGREH